MGRTSGADNRLPVAHILVALARARDDTPADGLLGGVGLRSKSLTEGWEIPLTNLKLIEGANSDSTAELAETRGKVTPRDPFGRLGERHPSE